MPLSRRISDSTVRRLSHYLRALEAFEEYLERAGESPDRDEVERRIRVLRIRLTEADAQAEAQAEAQVMWAGAGR